MAKWNKKTDGIGKAIQELLGRKTHMDAYLNRVAYPRYQQAQITRWETENQSETGQWASLSTDYATRKLKDFADFPGGGKAIMVATSRLARAAQGSSLAGHLKVITGTKMIVGINDDVLPYGKYAAGRRPVLKFGPATIEYIAGSAMRYFMTGREG